MLAITPSKIGLFTNIFLAIFIEAVPFLLIGTLASGAVEVFLDQDRLGRLIFKNPFLSTLSGAFMGLAFPVCECGVIPLVRRLYRKGLPLSTGITFMLAGPVLNPIVLFSTASAFGLGRVFFLRIGLTLGIALITGLVFSSVQNPNEILKSQVQVHSDITIMFGQEIPNKRKPWFASLGKVFVIAQEEFFEMGKFLVIGAFIAAVMQTFIPQSSLLTFGQGPVLSVLSMQLLAFVLSICSTVDAFVALGFVNIFSSGAVLAFLVFGPMVDIKSLLMYSRVFKSRTILYIILIPLLLSLLAGLVINLTGI